MQEEIKCQHCEYTWETKSEMKRVTCPSCNSKTKRLEPDQRFEKSVEILKEQTPEQE